MQLSRRGFTLIEMIVAMGLVAVIAGIGGAISFRAVNSQQLEQEKEKLVETLRQARSNALSGKKISCVTALVGWRVRISGSIYYLEEICLPNTVGSSKGFPFPTPISISQITVLFPALGPGPTATITLSGYSLPAKQITISTSGVIQ